MGYFLSKLKDADKLIIAIVVTLGVISLTMIESTLYDGGFVFGRVLLVQLIAYIVGFIAVIFVLQIDYHFFKGLEKWLYIAAILILLTVYIPGLGLVQYGSRAWIKIGSITTVQPSEFVKILFVFVMAGYLDKHKDELSSFKGLIKSFLLAAPIIGIVLKEDLGSALVYMSIWIFMVFFAGLSYKVVFTSVGAIAFLVPIAYRFLDDYQKERILAFLHPDNLALSGNYQVWQSKVAIGSGGIFGKGIFNGTQKNLDFIPVQQSDFIFSVVCEELGFLGGAIVILLYALLLSRFNLIIRRSKDTYGSLIVMGFLGMFLFQIFENIAMTIGLMPVTGITLPFLSGGGTSVIASILAIGCVLNVSSNTNRNVF